VIRIHLKFRDMPLKRKLYLCIILLIVVPLILTGFYLNNQFASLTLDKSSDIALQTLKQTRQNFDSLLADTNDLSLRILSNAQIQKFIKEDYNKTLDYDRYYRDIFSWLNDLKGSKTYFDTISIIDDHKVIFQMGTLDSNVNSEHVKRALALKGSIYWVVEGGKLYSYRRIMDFNKYGNDLGVVKINISEEAIYNFYKGINSYDASNLILVDSAGTVLSSSLKNRIGQKFEPFDEMKIRISNRSEGFFSENIGNKNNIVLFYRIAPTNWFLVQTIPESSFTPLKTTINTVLLIAIALCILFGFLFSLIQHSYLIKPLGKLRTEMAKLRIGNFNIHLNTESKDEIGEINQGFIRMTQQLKETINDVYISKIKQREAELTALQAQINPHFLYNTLDSIHWLAMKHRNYDVSEQIEALSEIFKHVLNKGQPIVTISKELDFLENYMFIQKAKYGQRIRLMISADPAIMDYKTPKLILQPLVENAILHGLEEKLEGGTIDVRIDMIDRNVRFVVSDDGIGTDQNRINRMMSGGDEIQDVFALKNIDDRIKLNYGREYGLKFRSQEGAGTVVEVLIPLII